MAPAYAVPTMLEDAGLTLAGLRLLRDPRGFRGAGAVHAQGLGVGGVLPRPARRSRRRSARSTARSSTWCGSSLAIGHPFAATGARIVATLAKLLAERGGKRGLISICTAGGMGVTAIVER